MQEIYQIHADVCGMFSKAGKDSSEKFGIIQKKDQIFKEHRRGGEVRYRPRSAHQLKGRMMIKEQQQIENGESKSKEQNQPFYKMLSRQKLDSIRSVKNPPPPAGYYRPRYTNIDKSSHYVWDIQKIYQKQTKRSKSKQAEVQQVALNPDKPKQHVRGSIEMSKNIPRDDLIYKQTIDPHESRFNYVHLSQSFSKIPRIPSTDLSKQKGRSETGSNNFAPNYNPNYEFGRKRIAVSNIPFDKIISRNTDDKIPSTQNENYFDHSRSYRDPSSNTYIAPKGPLFEKFLSREKDQSSPLPSFMQKNINSRLQLNIVHHKMLELNNYMDGRFQTVSSSFQKCSRPTSSVYQNKNMFTSQVIQ